MKHLLIFLGLCSTALAQTPLEEKTHGSVYRNSLQQDLIYLKSGSFEMGSPETEVHRYSNETLHQVNLTRPFLIGKTEVTQAEWLSIMSATPQELNAKRLQEKEANKTRKKDSSVKMPKKTLSPDKPTAEELATQKKLRAFGAEQKAIALKEKKDGTNHRFGDRYPMGFVNWTEAMEFCQKLTNQERTKKLIPPDWHYRLPTEAEWEYAARAGTQTPVFNGKQPDFRDETSMTEFSKHAWINPYSTNRVQEVAQLKANAWGLYDMLGNCAEWCLDIHAPFGSQEQTDPLVTKGPGMMRMYRGLTAHNGPLDIRTARRKIGGPRVPYWQFFGFRVVLAQETEATKSVEDNHLNR